MVNLAGVYPHDFYSSHIFNTLKVSFGNKLCENHFKYFAY